MAAHEFNVAHLDDLGANGLHQVEINGDKILLVRDGQHIRAIGGTCPHAGAPLVEGVRHGNRIICPWHKAAFCVRSGAVLDPPAVDALPRYDVRIDNGRILVAKPTDPPPDLVQRTPRRTGPALLCHRRRRRRGGSCRANPARTRLHRAPRHARRRQPRPL